MTLVSAERMPLSANETAAESPEMRGGTISNDYDESPIFVRWDARPPAK
jgi:hypothetical protein